MASRSLTLAGNEVTANRKPYQEGMVFRCNLDGSEFETLGWNFRNNWMVTVDSYGSVWQSDNDDDGNKGVRINYVMEFGNYGYKDEKTGAAWNVARTGMSEDIPRASLAFERSGRGAQPAANGGRIADRNHGLRRRPAADVSRASAALRCGTERLPCLPDRQRRCRIYRDRFVTS